MIYSCLLRATNLENRSYIHGTAIVRAVTRELLECYGSVKDFNIKLLKPLNNLPLLYVGEECKEGKPNAVGSFQTNGKTLPFYLLDSDQHCEAFIVDITHGGDIFLKWHYMLKTKAEDTFASSGWLEEGKQFWFTGMTVFDVNYLLQTQVQSIGYSEMRMLPKMKFERDMFLNGVHVGTRTAVYA